MSTTTAPRNLMLPGNPRYQPKDLQPIFGYDNLYGPAIEVELATLEVLIELGVIPQPHIDDVLLEERSWIDVARTNLAHITTTMVDERERAVTKHDVRALVQLIQEHIHIPDLVPWIHVPLTSYDVLETARALQYRRAYQDVLKPKILKLLQLMSTKVRQYALTAQIGRTHGQHALPITVGFWLATILNRLTSCAHSLDRASKNLVGKISGATGAYNAQVGLGIAEKAGVDTFESRVLKKLGLDRAPISTQILPPEPLAQFLHECVLLSAAIGQLGRDGRHLMRTEIAEVGEPFAEGQVGSSTMAHKRNPITFEGLEGMSLRANAEYMKVLQTLISEHQRDLVGSCVMRDFPAIVVILCTQLDTLLRGGEGKTFVERITIDEAATSRNFLMQANLVLAEPLYISLQMAGYKGDAHDLVSHVLVSRAHEWGVSLVGALERMLLFTEEDQFAGTRHTYDLVNAAFNAIPANVRTMLVDPTTYTGNASMKAILIAQAAEDACLNLAV